MATSSSARWSNSLIVTSLAGLLLAEVLVLGVGFDTLSLRSLGVYWWGRFITSISMVPHLAVAAATGMAIVGSERVRVTFASVRAADPRGARWPYLVAHALAYAAFVLVTGRVLGAGADQNRSRWIIPWLSLGVAMLVTLVPVAIARRPLAAILRGAWPALAAGLLVGLGAWAAGNATKALWQPLRGATLVGSGALLRLVRSDAFARRDDYVLGVPEFSVRIQANCSGYEGIGLALIFLAGFLLAFRRQLRFPQALVLLPIGMGVVWLGNLIRLAALVLVGTVSPRIALGGFHSYAGSLLFCLLILGVVQLARRWVYVHRPDALEDRVATRDGPQMGSSVEPYLVPLAAVMAAGLVTGLLRSDGIDWLYPARVFVAAAVVWRYRLSYRSLLADGSWIGVPIGITVCIVWLALVPRAPGDDLALAVELRAAQPPVAGLWLLSRAIGSVAVAPMVEELAFRGYLLRRLIARDFEQQPLQRPPVFALVASSVLFGLLHGHVLAATLAGIAYGLAAGARGRLRDALIAHSVTNALLVMVGSAWGRWSLWL